MSDRHSCLSIKLKTIIGQTGSEGMASPNVCPIMKFEGIEMINDTVDMSKRLTARVTGSMFLISLLVPMLNWVFVTSKFIVADKVIDTARNILANEFLFRLGVVNELITSVVAVVLALALYLLLKPVNKNLALLALLLKLTEAILLAVIALSDFISLLFLKEQTALGVSQPEQMQALIGLFINMSMSITSIPMVFLGLNLMLFLYLLYKSEYVPSILAGFGILSYTLIFIYALLTILFPNYAALIIIQSICWAPSCLFELTIGIWLLLKGVKDQPPTSSANKNGGLSASH